MDINSRLQSFFELGKILKDYPPEKFDPIVEKARKYNPWFTPRNIRLAFDGLARYLDIEHLEKWAANYRLDNPVERNIGVVMAGNIPLAGVHDFICVLISGHKITAKLSSQDQVLLPFVAQTLITIAPEFEKKIQFTDKLESFDAVIATGSDNSSRYFDYYFSKYPHIIRKNRTGIAVLNGQEDEEDLYGLSRDLFDYFGLGCRNISKVYFLEHSDPGNVIEQIRDPDHLIDHHKYANNYYYRKAVLGMNQTPHLDNGFALFVQHDKLVSPIATIYFGYYKTPGHLRDMIAAQSNKIQCVVSKNSWFEGSIDFGKAQSPNIWDYADNIDTMRFLTAL